MVPYVSIEVAKEIAERGFRWAVQMDDGVHQVTWSGHGPHNPVYVSVKDMRDSSDPGKSARIYDDLVSGAEDMQDSRNRGFEYTPKGQHTLWHWWNNVHVEKVEDPIDLVGCVVWCQTEDQGSIYWGCDPWGRKIVQLTEEGAEKLTRASLRGIFTRRVTKNSEAARWENYDGKAQSIDRCGL